MPTSATDEIEIPAIPSGTVAVIRDARVGLEVLMVRRAASARDTFSEMWVFPGGVVEVADDVDDHSELAMARRAAVRETEEEAGLELAADSLVALDRWEPEPRPDATRRFSAWVFVAPAPEGVVSIDGAEIQDHRWLSPAEALERHRHGEMGLVPPTWMTLTKLAEHESVASTLVWAGERRSESYLSRLSTLDDRMVLLWDGDELRGGPTSGRHRLWMSPGPWRYERT
jgi:8-oxo-dGTP pyrophosphatase MutT (NUDIX family)